MKKTRVIIMSVVALSLCLSAMAMASSNNNSSSGFSTPQVKIKEFREAR
ncbi:MAG: hypothetical protein HZA02_08675 [Nitrospinae bacterium]|nr:hypothetical protein [Nitrospinota bacterium]